MRLDKQEQKSLVLWTTDRAEHLLPYFKENYTRGDRTGTRTDQVISSVLTSLSLQCSVLPPEHEQQPYGRPVDEQRQQSDRRNEPGGAAGVG